MVKLPAYSANKAEHGKESSVHSLSMRRRDFFIAFVLLLAVIWLTALDFRYPDVWDDIRVGMNRKEVWRLAGHGDDSLLDWKGDFWIDEGGVATNVLNVYFDGDIATMITIERRVGSKHYAQTYRVRRDVASKP